MKFAYFRAISHTVTKNAALEEHSDIRTVQYHRNQHRTTLFHIVHPFYTNSRTTLFQITQHAVLYHRKSTSQYFIPHLTLFPNQLSQYFTPMHCHTLRNALCCHYKRARYSKHQTRSQNHSQPTHTHFFSALPHQLSLFTQ